MNYKEVISNMKCHTLEEAEAKKIFIYNSEEVIIGKLIPVGEWILYDKEKIDLIQSWRQKAMRMFLTHFESTFDKTLNYLKNFSIKQGTRIFFLIYDYDSEKFIGHMGISDVTEKKGELDNVMRGAKGGDPRFIYFSTITLLDWCFKNLGISQIDSRVLSYNSKAILLYKKVGFIIDAYKDLFKYEKEGDIFHDAVDKKKSNVAYKIINMSLHKKNFY